ncbi:Keratin, type II cytoskeletal 8 [Galemys pyrenaicus]|uniref:Keratin, type II cytoskeletal 8 n=1 Tax=Galemys pyrenaicus TaxID=202257 RepID=A0A8J5ZUP2_GALPY|nr:Keratin, type II cytoskeletal 8 [Galemys pyrenaicus]
MQGLVEDSKNKYEDQANKRTEMENECALIKKDVDEAHENEVELDSHLEGLTHGINFFTQLHEKQLLKKASRNRSVKAPYEEMANYSWAKAETVYQIKYKELLGVTGMTSTA